MHIQQQAQQQHPVDLACTQLVASSRHCFSGPCWSTTLRQQGQTTTAWHKVQEQGWSSDRQTPGRSSRGSSSGSMRAACSGSTCSQQQQLRPGRVAWQVLGSVQALHHQFHQPTCPWPSYIASSATCQQHRATSSATCSATSSAISATSSTTSQHEHCCAACTHTTSFASVLLAHIPHSQPSQPQPQPPAAAPAQPA